MATAPSGGFWQRRSFFNLYELLQSWWRHRVSFLISVGITLAVKNIFPRIAAHRSWPTKSTMLDHA